MFTNTASDALLTKFNKFYKENLFYFNHFYLLYWHQTQHKQLALRNSNNNKFINLHSITNFDFGKSSTLLDKQRFVIFFQNMHHLTDNFIFRKIKRLRKTESGKTIKSFENDSEVEFYEYEKEPKLRAPSCISTTTFDNFVSTSGINKQNCKLKISEENIGESFALQKQVIKSEPLTYSISSRRSCTSVELSESIASFCQSPELNILNNRICKTPTCSLLDRIANDEVYEVMKNCNSDLGEDIPIILNDPTPTQFNLPKTNINAKDKVINNPRELALPNKVLYKGEQINVEITGPIHFLTANTHQPNVDDKVRKPDVSNKNQSLHSLEKYAETLCNFNEIFSELDHKICKSEQNRELVTKIKKPILNKNKLNFYLKKIEPHLSVANIERPESAPYLVESKSCCHLARVIDITQEWRLSREALSGNVKALFSFNFIHCSIFANFSITDLKSINNLDNYNQYNLSTFNDSSTGTIKRKLNKPILPDVLYEFSNNDFKNVTSKEINDDKFDSLKRTIKDVEDNLNLARQFTRESRNKEAKLIEKAILDISDEILDQHEPLTRAQAEASEELLKTRLAEIILNIRNDTSTYNNNRSEENNTCDYATLTEPLDLLKNKLNFLEQFVEEEDSIREELNTITQLPTSSRHSSIVQKRELALKQRGEDIARMTPLISVVKQKLGNLEEVVRINEKNKKKNEITPYQERKTVHDLLFGINKEINNIHELCRQNSGLQCSNTVVNVLSKMCLCLDKILDVLNDYKATDKKSMQSTYFKDSDATITNCNVTLEKEEEKEYVVSFILNFGRGIRSITPKMNVKLKTKLEFLKLSELKAKHKEMRQKSLERPILKHFPITNELLEANRALSLPRQTEKSYSNDEEKCHQVLKRTISERPFINESKKDQSNIPSNFNISIGVSLRQKNQYLTINKSFLIKAMYARISEFIIDKEPVLDKTVSMQIICEESDDLTTISGFNKNKKLLSTYAARTPTLDEVGESSEFGDASSFISDESPVPFLRKGYQPKIPELDLLLILSESPNAAKRRIQERFKTLFQNANITEKKTIAKGVQVGSSNVLPIYADDKISSISISINDEDSLSELVTADVPILFRNLNASHNFKSMSKRETAILSDDNEAGVVQIYNQKSICTETFDLRKRNKRAVLNAIVFPEIRAEIGVTLTTDTFQVDVERMSETGRESVVMVSEEYYSKKIKITRSSDPLDIFIKVPTQSNKKLQLEDIDSDENESVFIDTLAKLNVSIMARSERNSVLVNLEEIPWGEVVYNVLNENRNRIKVPDVMNISSISQQTNDTIASSEAIMDYMRNNGSIVSNIIVAENQDKARSVTSCISGSPKSIGAEQTLNLTDIDNIPAYVIKQGSTAFITCELNTYANKQSPIQWYCGKQQINFPEKKYDKISHDLLEVLVILKVDLVDGQLYSIKVNGEIFPVAYLIIEDGINDEKYDKASVKETILALQNQKPNFTTPSQTMFVMQGQTAIISCQMNCPNLDILWFREHDQIKSGDDDRIFFEQTLTGWYRIIIEEVDIIDQGTYYAFYQEKSTSINLVVEGKI